MSGETDYLLVVTCRDMEAYNLFCRRVLANEHNIKRFRTSFNLSRGEVRDQGADRDVMLQPVRGP